jgi:hypothetical protein
MTLLGDLVRGLGAGIGGTAAMTLYQALMSRVRTAAQEPESSNQAQGEQGQQEQRDPWDDAPAPARVGRKFIRFVLRRDVSPERIGLLNNVVHWSYGTAWGGAYVLVQGSVEAPWLLAGLVFAVVVWLTGYVVLPVMKVYEAILTYPVKPLALDLSYHLVYGAVAAAAFRLLQEVG